MGAAQTHYLLKGQWPADQGGLKAAWAAAMGVCGPGEETVQWEQRAKWLLLEVGQQGEARVNATGAVRPAGGLQSRHSFPG